MNERIKQLINESHETVQSPGGEGYLDFNKEKFAEMIVRECMEVCKSRVGNSDYNTARMHCVSDLKEHFGVEP